MDIKKIYALSGLVFVLMVLSFNNCLKGGIDTRPQIDVYKSFLETNPLHWRPNRLATLSCSAFNVFYSGADNANLDAYRYPAFITWQQTSDGSPISDPYPAGLSLSPEAKAFFKNSKIRPVDQKSFLTALNVAPFLYVQGTPEKPTARTGKILSNGSSLFAIDSNYTGKNYYSRDSNLFTNDSNSLNLAFGGTIALNSMTIHLPPRRRVLEEVFLGLGFQKASFSNLAQSLFTLSTRDGEYVAGHSLRLVFDKTASGGGEESPYITPRLRELTLSSSNPDNDVIAYDTFGDYKKEKGESSQAGFRHDWECKNYVVTKSNYCQPTDTVPDIIEVNSPFKPSSGTPAVVSGYTGSHLGLPCFRVTNENGSNNSCYGYFGTDPVEHIHTVGSLPSAARDWYAVLHDARIPTAFLAYCKRKTY